ncbi:MAG: serine/threonine protein kinase [Variibacter sp.]
MTDSNTSSRAENGAPLPPELGGRWRTQTVLKRDVFSTIERGFMSTDGGEEEAVLRRIDQVPWWSRPIAKHFLGREGRALMIAGPLGIAPRALYVGRKALVRSWMNGIALHLAKPADDRAYFHSAKAALHALHHAGVTHNDLAKEQNWLRGPDGRAYLTDFQLATRFPRRGRIFRIAAYEDLRHLLKHKRRYAPDALTATERRILARKSWLARLWLVTGKRVYLLVTRGLLGFTDREGGGPRLVTDAPIVAARIATHPNVRDVAVVAFPDRRSGTGLYAFVEAHDVDDRMIEAFAARGLGNTRAPEHLQVVDRLPRNADGSVHKEILTLIAMNQVDLVADMTRADERTTIERIVAGRRNLRDRFNLGENAT